MAHGFTQKSETIIIEEMAEKNTQALDYDINGNLIYAGEAVAGSLKSVAAWSIKKLLYDVDSQLVDIVWANGNTDKINIWNDRTSLTYS